MEKYVTVRVPASGGGFTNTSVKKSDLENYYRSIGKEYSEGLETPIIYDINAINKAKLENPDRYADPINNSLNWAMFMAPAGIANNTARSVGQGISELLPRLSFSSTYKNGLGLIAKPTMGAIAADAALGAVGVVPGINSMLNDGVNVSNAAEVSLGLTPIFGPTYKLLTSGMKTTLNTINKPLTNFRVANALNKSIENTKFTNIPVYHTTTYTGSDLRPWSTNEWGLHITPNTATALRIAGNVPGSHIKEGTFTYTSSTTPIRISDQGSFLRGFGDFDYSGIELFDYLLPRQAENALAGSRNPSYVYNNIFEKGGDSFVITNPNESTTFSKTIEAPRYEMPLIAAGPSLIEKSYITNLTEMKPGKYLGYIGNLNVLVSPKDYTIHIFLDGSPKTIKAENYEEYISNLQKLHDDYVSTLPELEKELYLRSNSLEEGQFVSLRDIDKPMKDRTREIIDNFYKSPEYEDRFISKVSENKFVDPVLAYENFLLDLEEIQKHYTPKFFTHNIIRGRAGGPDFELALNVRVPNYDVNNVLPHEFGHLIYDYPSTSTYKVEAINNDLIGDASKYLIRPDRLTDKLIDYITDPNELRLRVIPAILEMFENGWNVELAYDNSKALLLSLVKDLFNKDYVIKLLGGLLTMTPLIRRNNVD